MVSYTSLIDAALTANSTLVNVSLVAVAVASVALADLSIIGGLTLDNGRTGDSNIAESKNRSGLDKIELHCGFLGLYYRK